MISTLPAQFLAWGPVKAAALLISIPNVGLTWWLALSIFDDKFQIRGLAWTGMIAETSGPILLWLSYTKVIGHVPAEIEYVTVAIALMLVGHAIWVGIASYRDDLIQPRREARIWIASLVVTALGVVLVAQVTTTSNVSGLLRVGIAFPVSVLSLFWLARFQTAILDFVPVPEVNLEALNIPAKDQAAHQQLLKIMSEDKPYLETDLSIGRLATRVGVPAHQLRTIINRGMGFRNFSAFLADYRITDVKQVLSDPKYARTPILTIALSHGFSSISTFNRAFKNQVGQTASEFRSNIFEDE